ncbi:PREDICTED: uncharacterized protein LOC106125607 [Papilio xuthus]|uniref:Uncharacterized protein LOC106125607 n=1 Tax=Papilio xuthus TaxID=66420 RepID=A0AAJ7EI79_PAPXU|nr:PREDICTED: uncharacterized protein LOC106125607 [Papilio xuthus]
MELETIKKFINIIRSFPEIYAVGQSDYKNMYKKEIAWKKIKEEMGMDIKRLKVKWRNLRDTYIKHKNCRRSGIKGPNTLYNWVWANEMAFVEPYIKFRSRKVAANTSADCTDSDVNVISDEENEQNETENVQSPEPEMEEIKKRPLKKRRHESEGDTIDNIMTNINTEINVERNAPETTVEVPCDRIDMEFLGYANTVKRLSLRNQALIKFQISKIITRHQLQELSSDRKNSTLSNSCNEYC